MPPRMQGALHSLLCSMLRQHCRSHQPPHSPPTCQMVLVGARLHGIAPQVLYLRHTI